MTRYQRAKRIHTFISFLVVLSGCGLFFVLLGLVDWIERGI